MMTKRKSELLTPIRKGLPDADGVALLRRRIALLFEHYKIDANSGSAWQDLALSLAQDHVPGFSISPRGNKTKWTAMLRFELLEAVQDRMKGGQNITEACEALASRPPFRDLRRDGYRPNGKTLHREYNRARKDRRIYLAVFAAATLGWRGNSAP